MVQNVVVVIVVWLVRSVAKKISKVKHITSVVMVVSQTVVVGTKTKTENQ
tara:strand:- start:598 stop:747 length:150 start_codon:yes stop_codon:yes gene_type:complete